ncbi:hypothetical protein [Prescottella agglutinans]|uniref:Peptidase S1 domain-containing protein n=1 Tax=Prescottella agglutinans TaxID=1644129 RepID=A0ABT6ML84_9NOCA|nr:hypothetical protein [Prescottella agglutinans]MDH6285067.1 hypothetical protein [Prescottella agglutinans]
MKRILIVLASIAAFVLPMLAFAPAASAATGIISNGTGISPFEFPTSNPAGGGDECTIGVVGTDNSGNKLAITVSHCFTQTWNYKPDGAPVYRSGPGPRQQIGTIAYRAWNGVGFPVNDGNYGTDWLLIKLNADADLRSNGPGTRIDGVGVSNPSGTHCKDGIATGVKCGWITDSAPPTRFYSTAILGGGDSGGPAYQGTQIIGLNRAIWFTGFEFVKIGAVLNEINGSPWTPGKGFVVTNN